MATVEKSNRGLLKFCAWMGPVFTLVWVAGAAPISNGTFILPPSAADTSAETMALYMENLVGIRIGCVFMIFACALYTFWNVSVTMVARRMEGDQPVLFYIQLVSIAVCIVVVMLVGFFWGVAAFRAGETTPEVTQGFNDLGWFGMLFTGAPFAAYQIALAVATLRAENPVFPRWSAFYNLFIAVFMIEASLIIFFKEGAFSQNGALVFYVPVIAFFVWICSLSFLVLRALKADAASGEVETDTGSGPLTTSVRASA